MGLIPKVLYQNSASTTNQTRMANQSGASWLFSKLGSWIGRSSNEQGVESSFNKRFNKSFAEADVVQPRETTSVISTTAPKEDASNVFSNVTSPTIKKSTLKDVRASDYITPQKYLDGAQIPVYYAFQSNMVPPEDVIHGMVVCAEVDRR